MVSAWLLGSVAGCFTSGISSVRGQEAQRLGLEPYPDPMSSAEVEAYQQVAAGDETPEALLRVALMAGGVTRADELQHYEQLARQRFDELLPAIDQHGPHVAQAHALLQAMHKTVLRSYSLEQTYVQVTLDTGVYNCVSSAVLFNIYAGWLGLPTGGVLRAGHAFSWVKVDDRRLDVETTSADGLEPFDSPAAYAAFMSQRGLTDDRREVRYVPNRVLISRILANRLGFAHDGPLTADAPDETLHAALAIAQRTLLLAPDDRAAAHNQAAVLSDVGVRLVKAGQRDQGFRLLALAVRESDEGQLDSSRQNLRWATTQLVLAFAPEGNWSGIDAVLEETRRLNDCARHERKCRGIDDDAQTAGWRAAVSLDEQGQIDKAWAVTEGILQRFPSATGSQNHIYFASKELARQWSGNRDAEERWVRGELDRLGCPAHQSGCLVLTTQQCQAWSSVDTAKALTWARLAFTWGPDEKIVRENYRAAVMNELAHRRSENDCADVRALTAELVRADLLNDAARQMSAGCDQ